MTRAVARAFKALGWSLAIALLVPLLGFLYYDLTRFQPHADEIAQLIDGAHPNERSPPPMLRKLLQEPRGDLSLEASRSLIYKLEPGSTRGNLKWKSTSLLWWLLVKIHLSEEEQLTIVCSTAFLGKRAYGFEAGANTYFYRPLNRLTDIELATLAMRARRPLWWQQADKQDVLAKAAQTLLERVRSKKVEWKRRPGESPPGSFSITPETP